MHCLESVHSSCVSVRGEPVAGPRVRRPGARGAAGGLEFGHNMGLRV